MYEEQRIAVDLLEIYHARTVRDALLTQLRRLAAQAQDAVIPSEGARQASTYYEAALITVVGLLDELGDRMPLD